MFDREADLGQFVESIRAGAFKNSLSNDGIMALYDHERRSVLGRAGAGTLRLGEDSKGLHFDLDLPDTTLGRDLAVLVKRGDVSGCSVGFTVPKNGDAWDYRSDRMRRELRNITLHEITVTSTPAYADTSVACRNSRLVMPRDNNHLYLATL